jgi:hypothetical protein
VLFSSGVVEVPQRDYLLFGVVDQLWCQPPCTSNGIDRAGHRRHSNRSSAYTDFYGELVRPRPQLLRGIHEVKFIVKTHAWLLG